VCCSGLQYVAVSCYVLQCVNVAANITANVNGICFLKICVLQCVAVCCSGLQCVAVSCSVWQ